MNVEEKIGGRAYPNGVRLRNSNYSVKAYYDRNNNLQVEINKVKRSKYFNLVRKIPVLRGIVSLLFSIGMFLKESINKPKKYWVVLLILLVDIIYIFLPSSVGENTMNILMIVYFSLPILLLIVFKNIISEILKYHGAEHKIVHYYENDLQGEINSYSRLHRRCGSNIVFYYFIISFGLGSIINFNINPFLLELIYLGLAYEAIIYTPKKLLFLPYLFQRLVTKEPERKHIEAARLALEVLTDKN